MASELRVNTLKDAAGNNSVGMEYVANGSAKHWANITNGGTVEDSFNQSSIVDNNPADCTYNFSSNLSNGLYANSSLATFDITTNPFRTLGFFGTDPTSSLFRTKGFFSTTQSPNDMVTSTVVTHGDLA